METTAIRGLIMECIRISIRLYILPSTPDRRNEVELCGPRTNCGDQNVPNQSRNCFVWHE